MSASGTFVRLRYRSSLLFRRRFNQYLQIARGISSYVITKLSQGLYFKTQP